MIELKKSLGGACDFIPAQLLPGTKSPNVIIFSKKGSLCLWNPRTKSNLALLEEVNKIPNTTTIIRLSRIPLTREILILAGLSCGKVLIWKVSLSKISIKFSWYIGHSFYISCIQISNKSSRILSGCLQGNIVLWDSLNNKGILRNKNAHKGEIKSLDFLVQKKEKTSNIISYGSDNLLKVWDSRTGTCLKIIDIGFENFLQIKIQKNKKLMLAINKNGEIVSFEILSPFTLKYSGKFQGKKNCEKPYLSDDLKQSILILNNGLGTINIFISKKPKKHELFIQGQEKSKKNFQDFYSNIIVYHFKNKTNGLSIWKGKNKTNWVILLHDLKTYILDFFRLSFIKNSNQKLQVSLRRLFKRKIDSHCGDVRAILWLSKDKFLLTLCNSVSSLYIWNLSLQKCVKNLKLTSSYISMEYFDNNSIIMGGSDGNIDLYEIYSGKLVFSERKAHKGPIWALDCAENSIFLGTGSSDGILKIWELEVHHLILIKKLKIKEQILNIKLVSSRNLVILSGISSVIWAFSLSSLEFRFSLQGHSLPIISLSLCDNKTLLATGSADLSLRIWDIFEKNQKKVLFPEETMITSISFQPASLNFFSASRGGNIKVWEGNCFIQLFQFNGYHQGPIWALKFSENGDYLASGSSDKNVLVWRVNNLNILNKFLGKKNENNPLYNKIRFLKNNKKSNKKLKKIIKKFKSTLKLAYRLNKKDKKCVFRIKNYLKKLFFELNPKYLDIFLKHINNPEIIFFINILIEKNKNFLESNSLYSLQEILKILMNLYNVHKKSKQYRIISKIRKKINNILKKEKSKAIKIIDHFKNKKYTF